MVDMCTRIWWVRPGVQSQAQQRHGVGLVDALEDLVAGARGATVGAHRHQRRRARRATDGRVDHASLLGDVALDQPRYVRSIARVGELVAQAQYPSGVLATTRTPEVPLSRRCTMPGRNGSLSPSSLSACIWGKRASSPATERARTLAGPGVHHLAGGLVDHREVLVVEHHVDERPTRRVRRRRCRARARPPRGVGPLRGRRDP